METKIILRQGPKSIVVEKQGPQRIIVRNFRTGTLLAQGGAPRGQSAYEQAVEGGYTGTKEEFEEALASGITTVSDNIESVNTVAAGIEDIETVAENLSDVHTVVENIADVNTVASISSDVSDVAANVIDITTVASISPAVQNVANNESNVTLVADNLANVNTVASNMNSVLTTAADITNINTVADDKTNIDSVATNISNVNAVAANEANINAVNANKTNIDAVASNIANVNTVAGISTDVSTVANIASDVTDVKNNAANITTVSTNISSVNTTASNISSVNTAASNISAIIAAPTQAANAAESASNAQKWAEGLDSDVTPLGGTHSAKGWTNECQQLVESIGSVLHYKGSVATYADLPTSGQQLGDMWNITADGSNYVWTGSGWDAISGIVDLSAYRTASAQDAIDAGKVNNTGAETIAGVKTFSNGIVSNVTGNLTGTATKATQDANGNTISSTYLKLSGGTLTGHLTLTNGKRLADSTKGNLIVVEGNNTIIGSANSGNRIILRAASTSQAGLYYQDTDGSGAQYKVLTALDKAVANGVASLDANTKVPVAQLPDLSGTYIDKTTADQEITAQKIVRNNWIVNALYILTGQNAWSWYRALAYAYSRIIIGNSSNVGLQLETNESNIKANINGTSTNVITALDTMTGATGSVAGTTGLVPAPAATDNTKFLRGDGTWSNPTAATAWGNITGTLSNQTDLQNALNSCKRNVGEIVESTIPLTDAGLHLLDGALLTSGSYGDFITYMATVYSSHPELFTTEADWQTSVTEYGVCGKFVYDSVNNTVRLPKISSNGRYLIYSYSNNSEFCRVYSDGWCEQGNTVYLGSDQSYKSFDITFYREMANTEYRIHVNSDYSGKTSDGTNYWSTRATTGVKIKTCGYGYSWSIAGYTDISDLKKETIYQYIVIANSTKTEIEVDIDEIATDLNNKVDLDGTNATFPHIVETYVNGASWYRVWSDGWCEQGGTETFSSTATRTSDVVLLKELDSSDYQIFLMGFGSAGALGIRVSAQSATGFSYAQISAENNYRGTKIYWEAKGYIS